MHGSEIAGMSKAVSGMFFKGGYGALVLLPIVSSVHNVYSVHTASKDELYTEPVDVVLPKGQLNRKTILKDRGLETIGSWMFGAITIPYLGMTLCTIGTYWRSLLLKQPYDFSPSHMLLHGGVFAGSLYLGNCLSALLYDNKQLKKHLSSRVGYSFVAASNSIAWVYTLRNHKSMQGHVFKLCMLGLALSIIQDTVTEKLISKQAIKWGADEALWEPLDNQ
jgi:hypothetical protein